MIDQDPIPLVYLVLEGERGINPLRVDNPKHLQAVPGKK